MESLITKLSNNTAHLINKILCKSAKNVEGIDLQTHAKKSSV